MYFAGNVSYEGRRKGTDGEGNLYANYNNILKL